VNNSALIEHIDQVGIEFYRKQLSPTNHWTSHALKQVLLIDWSAER
jgi:hypothetical protein